MKWTPGQRSSDIEDRRDEGGGGGFRGGGGLKLGLGGFILLAILSLVFKKNFFALLSGPEAGVSTRGPEGQSVPQPKDPNEEKLADFVSFVLDDVQATWQRQFAASGKQYPHAKLVLFRDATESSCGYAQSATGPFYCPEDQKVYIDLGFYDDLRTRFGAPGDFAEAYVLAHELGHHVQKQLGIEAQVRRAQEARPDQERALSVRLELQADCLAGVWAYSTEQRKILEAGDVESAIGAAAAVGDDRLQRMSSGRVNPETWTHGSSKERVEWFRRGMASGRVADCDTFGSGR